LTETDALINVEAAEYMSRKLLKTQDTYLEHLTFPQYFAKIPDRNGYVRDISLEPHVNLLMQYMLQLFNVQGLGANTVFMEAYTHLTTPGFFVEGVAVLTAPFMQALLRDTDFTYKLQRIMDNWKTDFSRKIRELKTTLLLVRALVAIEEGSPQVILRQVVSYLQGSCMFII
jgi:hypothetical protein